MRPDPAALDDAGRLHAADRDGLLHLAALAGAQVRSVAEAVREGVLAALAEFRPRSVVIVTGASQTGAAAVALVSAALGARIDVPIAVLTAMPGWVGPLDLVVLVGDDGGDRVLADAGARAVRRRAEVVVLAPMEGPLREAVAGRAIDASPRVPVPPELRFCGAVAGLLAVCAALTQVRTTGAVTDLDALAAALDAEAAAGHPERETFHNSAKLFADGVSGRELVWCGDDAVTQVIAAHCAAVLAGVAGVVGVAVGLPTALRAIAIRRATTVPEADSIFHDPQIDGPVSAPPRLIVVSAPDREWSARAVLGDFAADVLVDDQSADYSAERDELIGYLVLVLRVELAAVYLRLLGAGGA